MGVLFQVLEIIFEMQRKMNNEKIIIKEIHFLTYKTRFFFLGSFLLSNLITLLFLIYFKQFKVL